MSSSSHPSIADHNTTAAAVAKTAPLLQALLAALLGVVLLTGVGFAHIEAVHNAAHDTRHANGFPCH
jgi:cobalt transporter subunit CbtB